MNFLVRANQSEARGHIRLAGSKSISNRVLIIRALSGTDFEIEGLASAADTVTLQKLLETKEEVYDVGPAGTTFRFLTAYLALQPGRQILTGSERMLLRPIGPLVDALNSLGAKISYEKKSGYPPLVIDAPGELKINSAIDIPADISSQFISALLMIGPCLPGGLTVNLVGDLVSRPYLEMTLRSMAYFGIDTSFEDNCIKIPEAQYQPRPITIEADWSAASYHYASAALAPHADIVLEGLFEDSWQGDAVCASVFEKIGVASTWKEGRLHLTKAEERGQMIEHDYLECPDIAQTVAAVCAGLGMPALFTGLDTLRIKETDRIAALQTELGKIGVAFAKLPPRFTKTEQETFMVDGQPAWEDPPLFATYHDHRMAMALAPLAWINPVKIEDIDVVDKSYPEFWRDLVELGLGVEMVK